MRNMRGGACAMPEAISRSTGSATRWNSFTPSFRRHGKDQPFSVTTGLNGLPFGGVEGGAVTGDLEEPAS